MNRKKLSIILLCLSIFTACQANGTPIHKDKDTPKVESEIPIENISHTNQQDGLLDNSPNDSQTDTYESSNHMELTIDEDTEQPGLEGREINYQEVKPYEVGHIMIVMYHGILDNPPYHRTANDFIKDLEYMYEHGYRLISMRDYLDNHIQVEAGYTPIVLTFDDGLKSTFSLIEVDGELVPAPGTAIGMLEAFAKEHPDFGKAAALNINSGKHIFEGAGTLKQRLQWLVEHGYDVGNHTHTHANLRTSSPENIQKEIAQTDQFIKEIIPNYTVDFLAYPFGERPKGEQIHLIAEGSYDNHTYKNQLAMRVGACGPNVSPLHINFEPLNMPRVTGSEWEPQDLWWFFDFYENKHPEYRYISDGNPDRIALPTQYEHKINKDKLEGKELYLYELEEE